MHCQSSSSFPEYDKCVRCLIVGDPKVGKTTFVNTCTYSEKLSKNMDYMNQTVYMPIPGISQHAVLANIDGIKTMIYVDCANFDITMEYAEWMYKRTNIVIILFDMSNKKTFKNVDKWLDDVKKYCKNNQTIVLIGNKTDIDGKEDISIKEAEEFAKFYNVKFFQCRSKISDDVNLIFTYVIKNIWIQEKYGSFQTIDINI
jgi:small GTP-binding protein